MLISPQLIERSVAKAKRSKFEPVKEARRLAEDDRAPHVSAEQRSRRFAELLAETGSAVRAEVALERLLGGNDLSPVSYLERGLIAARSVCRVRLRDAGGATAGFGTGFLVGPGVLLTNHHVIASAAEAGRALAEFDYEYDVQGQDKPVSVFAIQADPAPIAVERLDFCLVAVAPRSSDQRRVLRDYGWLRLNPTGGKAVIGEYLTIIQHPGGERKQVCVRENKLLKYDEAGDTLWYNTDTVAGSSGSPVFNNSWNVVALHHSGVPKTDAAGHYLTVDNQVWDQSMDESRIAWLANEGIRISRILEHLATVYSDHPLAQVVVGRPEPPVGLRSVGGPEWGASPGAPELVDGEMRVNVPVRIAVKVGDLFGAAGAAAVRTPATAASARPTIVMAVPAGIEKVDVDQTDYDKRTGYQPDFLGGGLRVPLPAIKGTLKTHVVTYKVNGKHVSELKYWDYSVVMHQQRRLAIYSAVNVDANLRPKAAGRDGDRWYFDTRIAEEDQIGPEFYAEQTGFEVDRTDNPFDRGHLVRRLDAQWGTGATAKRNGDDSFHWTNCSPQHWRFNQGSKRWLGLEDYVIDGFAGGTKRACVINGPVFDAPLSTAAADGRVVPSLGGKRHPDPTFGGVAIPKLFFKVVACTRASGGLAAAAFLMSQEDFLATVDRLKGMPPLVVERLTTAEARLFQVRVADIESLTGLDFGPLTAADTHLLESMSAGPRIIRDETDLRLVR